MISEAYATIGRQIYAPRCISDAIGKSLIKFCNSCASTVSQRVPEGDTFARAVCDACRPIQYHNPNILVGCLPPNRDRLLICKRALEPRHALWTLSAGFMENSHSASTAAA